MSQSLIQSVVRGLVLLPVLATAAGAVGEPQHASASSQTPKECYQSLALVSDQNLPGVHQDPNLVNAWGIAFNPFGFVWVANNGTGTSTLYDGQGNPQSLVVAIPNAAGAPGGKPTGIVFNGGDGFKVSNPTASGPSRFLFASEDGAILGWAPNVDATHALVAVNNSKQHAIYKGLALATFGTGFRLFATDFHNGRVDAFDDTFHAFTTLGGFQDPNLPSGYAPFGIQNLNGDLYVTYAKQDEDKEDNVSGPGLGFVDVFDVNGRLLRRVASRGTLNAPWGIALAPADFGRFSNHLLVGNFGDGVINAFDPVTGQWAGRLHRPDGQLLRMDGLWGLSFGNGLQHQPTHTLFFAAGPNDESHGLYGRIEPAACRNDDWLKRQFESDNE